MSYVYVVCGICLFRFCVEVCAIMNQTINRMSPVETDAWGGVRARGTPRGAVEPKSERQETEDATRSADGRGTEAPPEGEAEPRCARTPRWGRRGSGGGRVRVFALTVLGVLYCMCM